MLMNLIKRAKRGAKQFSRECTFQAYQVEASIFKNMPKRSENSMQNGWCCPLATTKQKAAPQNTHTLCISKLKGQMSHGRCFNTRKEFIFSFPLELRYISITKHASLQMCGKGVHIFRNGWCVHSSSF